jgi:hypothetical protein
MHECLYLAVRVASSERIGLLCEMKLKIQTALRNFIYVCNVMQYLQSVTS